MSSFWLPEDLMLDVLASLPVKYLLRFRCVSKSWDALIDSQEFIKLHLERSIMNPKACQLLSRDPFFGEEHSGIKTHNLYAAEFDSPENLMETWQETSHPFLTVENISLVGSCNGLLCICREGFNDSLLLYNPWTKKDWKVPDQPMFKFDHKYGFGYDDVNDDYKVISIFDCQVQVYSLKSNSWRRVQDLPYGISCLYGNDVGVLTNCSLHWLSFKTPAIKEDSNPDGSIVAIDLRTEKFHLVPLPECTERQDIEWLGVLNGCLSLVTDMSHGIIIWVMKDYEIKDSWTKLTKVVH